MVGECAARGEPVARVVLTPSALVPEHQPEAIMMKARRLGLATAGCRRSTKAATRCGSRRCNVEDLLLRPGVKIDYQRLEGFLRGKAIVVTGGGGSIGAEICDRIVTFGAARVLVIENSEPALHAVLEALAAKRAAPQIEGRLADIRDRARIFQLWSRFQAGHRIPRRRAQARAAARTGLGRGGQDQRLRVGQCRRRGRRGRRDRDGDDLDRQGD